MQNNLLKKIIWLPEGDSSNNILKENCKKLDNLTALALRKQTAGRGQRGNTWLSAEGENLTFSLLLKPNIPASTQFSISMMTALSLIDTLAQYGICAKIKWPNDIYVGKRKICGILIENLLEGNIITDCIIGIGLNVNQSSFPEQLFNPASMSTELKGQSFDLNEVLEKCIDNFCNYLSDTKDIKEKYLNNLFNLRKEASYRDCSSGEIFKAQISDVLDDGRLRLDLTEGVSRLYSFKEVSFII